MLNLLIYGNAAQDKDLLFQKLDRLVSNHTGIQVFQFGTPSLGVNRQAMEWAFSHKYPITFGEGADRETMKSHLEEDSAAVFVNPSIRIDLVEHAGLAMCCKQRRNITA